MALELTLGAVENGKLELRKMLFLFRSYFVVGRSFLMTWKTLFYEVFPRHPQN